ncbi:MAG: helix-turn-helix transcriptional regulator [Microcella sp.]|nr:MAG: helix-turn-helix transcriptional regulator [Microcella sp.]
MREAVENLRDTFAPRAGARESHRGVRGAILAALTGEPMNGHQIINAIAAASGGEWMPSAGAVYPTLQLLTDEGLVSTQHDGERTVYALTDAGRAAAADASDTDDAHGAWHLPHWADRGWADRGTAVPKAGAKLAQAVAVVAQSGTREQQERAAALLDQTRKSLYAILAED